MDFDGLIQRMDRLKAELSRLRQETLPVKTGNLAVRHFKQNFRRGGYQDGSLQPWPITRRQRMGGRDAASQYGPLLSRQNRLMSATRFVTSQGKVTVVNDVPYARIHNEGGSISQNIPITPGMRKFAWAKFFEASAGKKGKEVPEAAKMWRGLALTKKTTLSRTVHIPRRQFLGKPRELVEAVNRLVREEVKKLLGA
jgi:phage gpG-like protein